MRCSLFLKRISLLVVTTLLLSACGLSTVTPTRSDQPTTARPVSPSVATTSASNITTTGPTLTPTAPPLPTVTPSPTLLPTPQGEIVLWEQIPPDQQNFLKSKIEAFQKLYPSVQITVRHFDSDAFNAQLAEAGQDKPQLLIAPAEQAGEWQRVGLILPVEGIFDKTFLNNFAPNLLQGLRTTSGIGGIPYSFENSLLLFYNKKLIATDKVPDSWEAMTNFVRANPAKRGEYYPFAADLYDPDLLLAVLDAYGGAVLDQNNQPRLNTPQMQQALQFLQDAVFKNKLVPLDPNYPQMQLLFRTGQLAMIMASEDNLSDYQSGNWNKLEVGIAPLPKVNGTTLRSPGKELAYFIGSTVRNDGLKLAATQAFIKFMSSLEQQHDFLTQLKQLPVTRAGLNDPIIKKDPLLSARASQMQNSLVKTLVADWQAILEAIRSPISAVIASRASAAEGAAAMQDLIQKNPRK